MANVDVVSASLDAARAGMDLVRVVRRARWDRLEGYVAGSGSKWVLLWRVDDRNRFDGFSAVRRRDICRVDRVPLSERFVRRVLEIDGCWPPTPPSEALDLSRTRAVVRGLAGLYPLITVLIEREDPGVAFIGRPQRYVDDGFWMRSITPNAEWDGPTRRDWSRWRYSELSRIDAGGGYESALARVAGEPDGQHDSPLSGIGR